MFVLLVSCASQKPKLSGKDFVSPVDLAVQFYDQSRDEEKALQSKDILFNNGVRQLHHQWCMTPDFSSDEFSALMSENCSAHEGNLVQGKFCIAKNSELLKFIVLIEDFNSRVSVREAKHCKDSNSMAVTIREYSPNTSTEKPQLIYCSGFSYPIASERSREEGEVALLMKISAEGKAIDSKIESSSGFPRLDEASLKRSKSCVYVPKIINGNAVEDWTQFRSKWRLAKDDAKK